MTIAAIISNVHTFIVVGILCPENIITTGTGTTKKRNDTTCKKSSSNFCNLHNKPQKESTNGKYFTPSILTFTHRVLPNES